MKKVLILGATGKLGKELVSFLLIKKYEIIVLVRNPQKLNIRNNNLKIINGDVTNSNDLSIALVGIDVVISTLGHGFRTKYPILEKNLEILIPLMEQNHIKRFITVTGAALKTNDDKDSFILSFSEKILGLIDPFRLNDSRKQQKILDKSNLDWTVIRTPIHKIKGSKKVNYVGFEQPSFWKRISRIAIVEFIIDCMEGNRWIRKSPIIH